MLTATNLYFSVSAHLYICWGLILLSSLSLAYGISIGWQYYGGLFQWITSRKWSMYILYAAILYGIGWHLFLSSSWSGVRRFGGSSLWLIDQYNLVFGSLIALLFLPVIILMRHDFNAGGTRLLRGLLLLYTSVFMLLYTQQLILFYILYEFIVFLVFYIMYLTSNSRGGIESALFFLGWAILGSCLVGSAIMCIFLITRASSFSLISQYNFTPNEIYYLYILFFFGFGTKLSIWPFWYWLPRAHVEVSTGMSIFLSCILIKLCLYTLYRMYLIIGGEWPIILPLICCSLGVFDVAIRLILQTDLKAITAYGSVLHVNLLILLILVDTVHLNGGIIFYIWGHSYATAGIFLAINLVERCSGTRSTYEIAGLYGSNPHVSLVCIFALITFLEFPLTFFFWGEVWLWLVLIEVMPLAALIIMYICTVLYVVIFFRLWWGILFGAPTYRGMRGRTSFGIDNYYLVLYVIGIQYLWGMQPGLLFWGAIE